MMKRDFILIHEDVITIITFGGYREVMKEVINIIKEANIIERKRGQTTKMRRSEETAKRTQRAKTLIANIKKEIGKDEIARMLEEIFGNGRGNDIETAPTKEKIDERIEETTKIEEQIDSWEKTRQ